MSLRRSIGIKRGCELCRVAHSKCDRKRPRCGRCSRFNKDCIREPAYRFMNSKETEADFDDSTDDGHSAFEYPESQVWVQTPKELEFVNEGLEADQTIQLNEPSSGSPCHSPSYPQTPTLRGGRRRFGLTPLTASDDADGAQDDLQPEVLAEAPCDVPSTPSTAQSFRSPVNHNSHTIAVSQGTSISVDFTADHDSITTESVSPQCFSHDRQQPRNDDSISASLSPLYGYSDTLHSTNPWQLTGPDAPMLMRYFSTDLSRFFDYCDPERSFSTTVVQRAVGCPTLLLAILAVSSRHLSLTSGYDSYQADQYHRECLALLIPMLNDRSTLLDEAICAATVILRLYEEISVTLFGKDTRSHILGTHIFVAAQEYRASGILQAAFRVAIRQEINVAFFTRRPVRLLAEYVKVDRSTDLTSDWSWAFRIIVLCAEVLNHCYCSDLEENQQPWTELSARAESWLREKPASFEPLQCKERNASDRVFPEIWLLNDCHVAGHIYYLMCHILLTAYDPRKPRLGPGRAEATRVADEVIKDDVRKICGIALSNPHAQPSMFKACTVISLCGDLFTDRLEQQALLEVLMKTEVDLAWPTATSQEYLRERWGWT